MSGSGSCPAAAARPARARRILVLGCPGAGKTTAARRLAAVTGLPLHHLDDLHWGAGWSRPDPADWTARQAALVAGPCWIVDGNYLPSIHVRAARAELVVMLDASPAVCLRRVVARAARIRAGRLDLLPARVRAAAGEGSRVRATHDFSRLVRQVLRFRVRDRWVVLEAARTNPESTLVVAVQGRPRRHAAVAAALRRREIPALVLPAAALPALLAPDRPEGTG